MSMQIKHRRLVRGDRAVPPPYDQLLAQRTALYKQLQELQVQGNTTWKLEVPEQLLSPRSRLAANAARRLAQGMSRGVHTLGAILGDFGNFLAGEQQPASGCCHTWVVEDTQSFRNPARHE